MPCDHRQRQQQFVLDQRPEVDSRRITGNRIMSFRHTIAFLHHERQPRIRTQLMLHWLQAALTHQRDARPHIEGAGRHGIDRAQDQTRLGNSVRLSQSVTQSDKIRQRKLAFDDSSLRRLYHGIEQRFPGIRHGGGMIVIRAGGVKATGSQIIVF
jgi:hypothetical protein